MRRESPAAGRSPNGKNKSPAQLLLFSTDKFICICELHGHTEILSSLSYSPDGTHLVSASGDDNELRIYNTRNYTHRDKISSRISAEIAKIIFSPDNNYLVTTGSFDNTIKIYNRASELVHTIYLNTDTTDITYSPDGMLLATTCRAGAVRIWDAKTFQLLTTLNAHTGFISVAFSPDNKYLLTGAWDRSLKKWERTTDKWEIYDLEYETHPPKPDNSLYIKDNYFA